MEKNGMRKIEVLAIGGSAGSLDVIMNILPQLKADLSLAIIIVLHRKNDFESILADLFSSKTSLPVREAEEKETIAPGTIYLAPADYHLLIEEDKSFSLDFSEKILYSRPAIDATFETAAEVYRSSLAGLLLSGANADGSEGLVAIHEAGGLTAIQDPDDAEISYMPKQALLKLQPDVVLRSAEIADFVNNLSFTS